MNMQSMLKQAQNMQNKMMKAQEEVAKMTFTASKDLVTVEVNGNRKVKEVNSKKFYGESSYVKVELVAGNVTSIKIDTDKLDKDDIEMLEDMLIVAIGNAKSQYDKEMEEKMGAYTKGIPGLF